MRLAPKLALSLVLACLLGIGTLRAEDAPPTLERHPMNDAKAGEYVRFEAKGKQGWVQYSVQRVIEVSDGKAYIEEWQSNEAGDKLNNPIWHGWARIPEKIEPLEYQKITDDEMVQLELDGKQVWCRHITVDQPESPPLPEPRMRREVWFSNDVPGWGRVKEVTPQGEKIAVAWGQMSEEDLKKALEMRDRREKQREE